MDPIFIHYGNEEEDMHRRAILNLDRKTRRNNFNPFDLPDGEFRKLFRLNKGLFQILVNELTPHLQIGRRTTKLSIHTRILAALRFFATGSYQKGIGDEHCIAISQQSMSNAIAEVAAALETIAPRWIQFPIDNESRQAIQVEFMNRFGFPGIIGAVDGTHIAILEPMEDEHVYFNRKGFHSKNVQIICDANLEILNVNANFGGAAHDAFIWRNSNIYWHLQQDYQREPNQRTWLIGDSGYPLQPWLMTPITNTAEGSPERRYDDALTSARNCVERCIGTLKGRFRCLLKERMLRYDPHKAGVIINACCVLHNICRKHGDPFDDIIEEEDIEGERFQVNDYFPANVIRDGQRQRQDYHSYG